MQHRNIQLYSCISCESKFFKRILYLKQIDVITGAPLERRVLGNCPRCHGRIKRGNGDNWPGTPLQGLPVMKFICFKQNTRLKNFCDSEAIQEYNSILYSYIAFSIRGPQQQLISLQQVCQTHFHRGSYQHYGCPERASCNRMVALKGPAVTELTTIIYANAQRASLWRNNVFLQWKEP